MFVGGGVIVGCMGGKNDGCSSVYCCGIACCEKGGHLSLVAPHFECH